MGESQKQGFFRNSKLDARNFLIRVPFLRFDGTTLAVRWGARFVRTGSFCLEPMKACGRGWARHTLILFRLLPPSRATLGQRNRKPSD
jgi:hypothetical protein